MANAKLIRTATFICERQHLAQSLRWLILTMPASEGSVHLNIVKNGYSKSSSILCHTAVLNEDTLYQLREFYLPDCIMYHSQLWDGDECVLCTDMCMRLCKWRTELERDGGKNKIASIASSVGLIQNSNWGKLGTIWVYSGCRKTFS